MIRQLASIVFAVSTVASVTAAYGAATAPADWVEVESEVLAGIVDGFPAEAA